LSKSDAYEDKHKILIVDDEESHRIMLSAVLDDEGYAVTDVASGREALNEIEQGPFDLVLMDLKMEEMDGIETLREIRKVSPLLPIIIMTAYASVKTAVDALKAGAFDYLTKPLDLDELKVVVKKGLEYYHLRKENRELKERLGDRFDFSSLIGKSRKMRELIDTLSLVAPTDATVLLLGESGTGKEVVANAIHQNSLRSQQPFIKVSCAALPETLLEAELFGHERGAFTGAYTRREGRFQLAHRGTIFLDEIGEMSLVTQAKLLRALYEKEIEPLGSTHTVRVDVRVIAATNRDLSKEVKEGRFREDLYYRLNVVPIVLPPLRERREDIPELALHFFRHFCKKNRKEIKGISPKAVDLLVRYDWPGNVRELENVMERVVIMARKEIITPEELPVQIQKYGEQGGGDLVFPPGISLQEVEKRLIIKTLRDVEGNRSRAAKVLGINRRTLQNKLKEYGL